MNRYTWKLGILEIFMIVLVVIFAIPIAMVVSLSLRTQAESSNPFSWPDAWVLDNFINAWNEANLAWAGLNSVIVAAGSVTVLVFFSALAAYPLARITATWSKVGFYIFMFGMVVPFQLGLIPFYSVIRDMGLLGSPVSLIIFYAGLQMPFSIFLYTQFLREIPSDFEEAAQLDGASDWRVFFSVMFPLLMPVTGTVIILNLILIWNDFFVPLLFLSGTPNQTIPVALYSFVGQYGSNWNLIFAGLLIGSAPILIVYFLMQKSVFRSFAGGLKG